MEPRKGKCPPNLADNFTTPIRDTWACGSQLLSAGGSTGNQDMDFSRESHVMSCTSIKSSFVLNRKENILRANGLLNLTWVRALAGNPGNELAAHFEKNATNCGEILRVPAPYSFLKKRCF
ncbi:hypothetical protein AVEN_58663-1 [Araneus ventricosus]|uniref:Uncharacterized protein n=1 Tax=Araneus ventricosus TaxID=182803 RepID=A0A4Y2I7X1_ARAVE|nr:hypothetical protein AVEN_58663-1 [Araneus ventricosus]